MQLTEDEQRDLLRVVNRLTVLAGQCAMALAEAKAFTPLRARYVEEAMREIAAYYEKYKNDEAAAQFWTGATLVARSAQDEP